MHLYELLLYGLHVSLKARRRKKDKQTIFYFYDFGVFDASRYVK